MPLIAQMHAWAQRANMANVIMSRTQAPTHLNWQQAKSATNNAGSRHSSVGDNRAQTQAQCAMRTNHWRHVRNVAPLEGADLGQARSPCQTS